MLQTNDLSGICLTTVLFESDALYLIYRITDVMTTPVFILKIFPVFIVNNHYIRHVRAPGTRKTHFTIVFTNKRHSTIKWKSDSTVIYVHRLHKFLIPDVVNSPVERCICRILRKLVFDGLDRTMHVGQNFEYCFC